MSNIDWTMEERRVEELSPYKKNPRKISKENTIALERDMDDVGLFKPFVLDYDGKTILGGNKRYGILLKKRYKDPIKVMIPSRKLTEKEKKKIVILDNVSRGEFDVDKLMEEFTDVLNELDLEKLIPDQKEEVEEDDYKEPEQLEVKVVEGDLWKLGRHRLLCGSSTNVDDVKRLVGEDVIKVIVTSPPYNMASDLYRNYDDNMKSKEYIQFNLDVVNLWKTYLKGFVFWNISYNKNSRWEFIEIMYKMIKETGLKFMELIVWDKEHAIPITAKQMLTRRYEDVLLLYSEDEILKDHELYTVSTNDEKAYFNKKTQKGISNYWKIDTSNTQVTGLHHACFPVKLPARAIGLMSEKGEIVADPFGGSGSTLIAAEQLGRKCITMELDPHYCQVIIDRWEKLTGEKAIRDV